ncbi:unnamed protein product [Ilex paraguariensis]|uniref:Trimethylguanosine synthase n=1 Tax=Ilex paraguariensis TaxID=185542 RepID=A0ABC8QXA1_9AQUA
MFPVLQADTIFLSPPWGGPDYVKRKTYDIKTMLKPHNGQFLFNVAKGSTSRIVMFLPRNVDINHLAELSLSVSPPWSLEVIVLDLPVYLASLFLFSAKHINSRWRRTSSMAS